jgi:hypothetical protein
MAYLGNSRTIPKPRMWLRGQGVVIYLTPVVRLVAQDLLTLVTRGRSVDEFSSIVD